MGAVYLARDLRLEREIAIKTMVGTSALRLMQLRPESWAMATVARRCPQRPLRLSANSATGPSYWLSARPRGPPSSAPPSASPLVHLTDMRAGGVHSVYLRRRTVRLTGIHLSPISNRFWPSKAEQSALVESVRDDLKSLAGF